MIRKAVSALRRPFWWFRCGRASVLIVAVCVTMAALVGLGVQARREARQSTRLLLDRRVAEQLALLWAGIAQDMRGAHATVLAPVTPVQLVQEPPYDLAEAFARGFARFPYPEFFFIWRQTRNQPAVTYVFTRESRPPPWGKSDLLNGPYPVEVARNPAALAALVALARRKAGDQPPVALFDTTLDGDRYQVIVNYLYGGAEPGQVLGLVGFGVNLAWIRAQYFEELISQIAQIGGQTDDIALQVLDGTGEVVASTRAPHPGFDSAERRLPLAFVDRSVLAILPRPDERRVDTWTVRVSAALTSPMAAAASGVDSDYLAISFAGLMTVVGLIMTIRGVRATAELATMKSDFVSSTTHELKSPLGVIRLIADTLAQGRYQSEETVREYAALLSNEARNLGRLVENVLAYGRLSDVKSAYRFEALSVSELIDDALERFQTLLGERDFIVEVDVSPDVPCVWADRVTVLQALDNIIDNAIKYSESRKVLRITGRCAGQQVVIAVADEGMGIRDDEIARVGSKFFRGRDAKRGGSGLGLAIVNQVVKAHRGELHVSSTLGQGTCVEMVLPVPARS